MTGAQAELAGHHPRPGSTVALLVLAHAAPRCLEGLAQAFEDERFRVYVHLDHKTDLARYSEGRRWPGNLRFVDTRLNVYWGGFNMIRATESLLRAALQDPANAAFCLVSDDTLPLHPASRIHHELLSRPDRIDVGLYRRNPPFLQRYTHWFFLDAPATSARPMEVQTRFLEDEALEALERLGRARLRGKYPFPEVWGGSQWWSLGRATVEPILAELSGNTWLRESFEFSAVPDELAFQTLYANRLGLSARSFTSPMLTDVTRVPAPFVFRGLEEMPAPPEGKLFVRKVGDEAAASLMRQVASAWPPPC